MLNERDVPKIKVERRWSWGSVRRMCIKYELYTGGSKEEYIEMLNYVDEHKPTVKNLYIVAENIKRHSETDRNIENIMFLLEYDAVLIMFNIK